VADNDKDRPQITQSSNSNEPPTGAPMPSPQQSALQEAARRASRLSRTPPPPPPSGLPRSEPEPPPSPKAGDHEHHPTTKTLDYLALGIILAPAPEVIAMYLRHEDIDWQRVAISFVVSTIIGSAILWFAHGWHKTAGGLAAFKGRINRADDYFVVRAAIIAFFMIVPVLIAPLISGAPVQQSPTQPGFTQQQVDAKIATALANVNSQLAEAIQQKNAALAASKERDELAQQLQQSQKSSSPTAPYTRKLGPIAVLNAFSESGAIWRKLVPSNTGILITATPENRELAFNLSNIFQVGMREVSDKLRPGQQWLLQSPDYGVDIDAPRLPSSGYSGMVIHGSGDGQSELKAFLERCFVTRQTPKTTEGLANYYKLDNVFWIEIGSGSPWKPDATVCSG
jgi:hypothetical protein